MNTGEQALVITRWTRTPCCERVPHWIGSHRYVCKGCGQTFTEAAELIRAAFGPVTDVTRMTPRRWRA